MMPEKQSRSTIFTDIVIGILTAVICFPFLSFVALVPLDGFLSGHYHLGRSRSMAMAGDMAVALIFVMAVALSWHLRKAHPALAYTLVTGACVAAVVTWILFQMEAELAGV